jgi:hypothetical protein
MGFRPKACGALCAILAGVCLGVPLGTLQGQEAEPLPPLLADLKAAADFERAAKRTAVVKAVEDPAVPAGQALRQALVAQAATWRRTDDRNFVGHCFIALGELRAQEATSVLLEALESPVPVDVYLASQALGRIWAGKDATSDQARQVILGLLVSLYSMEAGPASYGPGVAVGLVTGLATAEQLHDARPEEILAQADAWVDANPAVLPPVAQRPWQMLLRAALTGSAAARTEAVQAMRQQRNLAPVESLLEAQAGSAVPAGAKQELAELLGELTGIAFPPQGVEDDPKRQVAAWHDAWHAALATRQDQRLTDYVWQEIERSLRRYHVKPSDVLSGHLAGLRSAVIRRANGPGDIPAEASSGAVRLTQAPLAAKEAMAGALGVLGDESATDFDKVDALGVLQEQVNQPYGPEVGQLFVRELAHAAYREANHMFQIDLGFVLGQITGIPLDLSEPAAPAKRKEKLAEWARTIAEKKGIQINLPQPPPPPAPAPETPAEGPPAGRRPAGRRPAPSPPSD